METRLQALQRSATGKALFVAALTLLLLVPLEMIERLIAERAHLYDMAREEVATTWGRPQIVGGPILIVPFEHTGYRDGQPWTITDELYALPERFDVAGNVDTQERSRGIYRVPVYSARLRITGSFAVPTVGGEYENPVLLWDRAEIALPITGARSVREPIVFSAGGGTTTFAAGSERVAGFGTQLVASYAALGLGAIAAPLAFSFDLALDGTMALRFLPVGDETRVELTSNWPSPNFLGAFLPRDRTVTASGFTADWRVLALNRGYPSVWRSSARAPQSVMDSAFGAQLITPIGIHQATLRAAKYAVLIIGLTFAAYFLFELFAGLRLHALQYLLIGMANCVFFLLLLALAEHIGFGPAYAASGIAATALVTSYSGAVLRSLRRAAPIGGVLAALYGYLYVTLKAEDYALLFGALGAFAALATFMHVTRRVDWYSVTLEPVRDDGQRAQLHP